MIQQENLTDSFALSEASPKDKPWDKHRANADKVQKLYRQLEYDRYADRMEECSQWLLFGFEQEGEEGALKFALSSAKFCRVRHCPVCQWRRSLMWFKRFHNVLPKVLEDYPKGRFLFLTLTAKNCQPEELRSTVRWMNSSWRKMVRRKSFPAIGWIKSVEVTRSSDGLAHPHFHIILMVNASYFKGKNYLSHEDWVQLWKESLKVNYDPIVNIKAIRAKGDQTAIISALKETLKYTVKEVDLQSDMEWLKVLTQQLHNVRALGVGGILKDYLSEDESQDFVHLDENEPSQLEEETAKLAFTWREREQKYRSA